MKQNRRFQRGEVAVIAMKVGSQWAAYDYRVAQIDQGNGKVVPYQSNDVVMVPIKAVAEGFQGLYQARDNGARIRIDDTELALIVGADGVVENHGCLFMPLETMGEMFGLDTVFYADTPYADGVFAIGREQLSIFEGPNAVPSVEVLLCRVNNLREYVSMEVPKALYDLIDVMPGIDLPDHDALTMGFVPEYAQKYEDLYEVPEEATRREGVPAGQIRKYHLETTETYPGIKHNVWTYVPSQYDGYAPAKLLILTDGPFYLEGGYLNLPNVLDNLIHEGRLPITIALFVSAGHTGPGNPAYRYHEGWKNNNRSAEADTVDERYSNFIVDEVMPMALNGLNISEKGLDRAILGISSTGPGAFGVAWHRSAEVGTVISLLGTFTHIRGAFVWPYAVRREKRNIRTFLLTSRRDTDLVFGNAYLGNAALASGFDYSGYDYLFAIGRAGHGVGWPLRLIPRILRWSFAGEPFEHPHVELRSGKVDIET